MKQTFRVVLAIIFVIQIVFLAYKIPQIIYLDYDVTKEIKLSAVIAGITIGVLFFTKGKSQDTEDSNDR